MGGRGGGGGETIGLGVEGVDDRYRVAEGLGEGVRGSLDGRGVGQGVDRRRGEDGGGGGGEGEEDERCRRH